MTLAVTVTQNVTVTPSVRDVTFVFDEKGAKFLLYNLVDELDLDAIRPRLVKVLFATLSSAHRHTLNDVRRTARLRHRRVLVAHVRPPDDRRVVRRRPAGRTCRPGGEAGCRPRRRPSAADDAAAAAASTAASEGRTRRRSTAVEVELRQVDALTGLYLDQPRARIDASAASDSAYDEVSVEGDRT